ncbi:hypothetical protein NDU88_006526 [Pleurodeles waltl]|uniref:Uncharacterized protein n=1 Tax=Pleurodeles waltl TaxID=8319 RepID=A0AAV7PLP8_PLEWA|nr:hypothetical protein NDU88_006526 [Pleurodeles waltl]
MGAPFLGVLFEPPLLPRWTQGAWSLHRHRGVAARLRFQGSRGRVSTGLFLALPGLNQDLQGELALELPHVKDVCQHDSTPQASHHLPSCMTSRCPSGPGARTRLRGQKLPSLKHGLELPALFQLHQRCLYRVLG